MKALTLRCPWAWAVTHCGKRIENRTWRPPSALIGQRIAIHAGKAPRWSNEDADDEVTDAIDWMDSLGLIADGVKVTRQQLTDLSSAIVATAIVGEPITASESPWFVGPVGWPLLDVEVLHAPVLCRGAQGLWEVPTAFAEAAARGTR